MRNANIRAHVASKTKKVSSKGLKNLTNKMNASAMADLQKVNPSEIFFDTEDDFLGDTFFAESFGSSSQFIRQSISRGYLG